MVYWLIGIGGFIGAILRFLIGEWISRNEQGIFPLDTLIVNLSGSFILMFVYTVTNSSNPRHEKVRQAIGIGMMGAYTTFSALSTEALELLRSGKESIALLYIGVSMAGGLLLAVIGFLTGSVLLRMVKKEGVS